MCRPSLEISSDSRENISFHFSSFAIGVGLRKGGEMVGFCAKYLAFCLTLHGLDPKFAAGEHMSTLVGARV